MNENLIAVAKDGQRLEVNPDCLAAHIEAGWVIAGPAPAPVEEKPRKSAPPASSTFAMQAYDK